MEPILDIFKKRSKAGELSLVFFFADHTALATVVLRPIFFEGLILLLGLSIALAAAYRRYYEDNGAENRSKDNSHDFSAI